MPEHESKTLLVEDAKLLFRNLSGFKREYNSEGDRNFSVLLEPGLAKRLLDEGWRVKQLKPREGQEEGDYHIKVNVNYDTGRPPRVVAISSKGQTDWGQTEVGNVDIADIKKADVLINGWWSDFSGGGYSAYLKSLFITLNEDYLELKYSDLDDKGELVSASEENEF